MTATRKSSFAGISVISMALVLAFWPSSPWHTITEEDTSESLATMPGEDHVKRRRNSLVVTKNTDFQVRVGSIKAHLDDPEGWTSIEPWLNLTFQESPDVLCRVFEELLEELQTGGSWERSVVAANLGAIALWMHCEKGLKGADEKLYATATDDLLSSIGESWLPAVSPGDASNFKYHWSFEASSKLTATGLSKERRNFLLRLYGAAVVSDNSSKLWEFLESLPADEQDILIGEIRDVHLIEELFPSNN